MSLFFQQIIPPGGNTSFDVVFLARVVGNVENTLFINTSHHGVFTYQVQMKWHTFFFLSLIFFCVKHVINVAYLSLKLKVFGVGIPNPYRLRPFIGARVPVNSSFSPLINIHNPYSEPLQVIRTHCTLCLFYLHIFFDDWFGLLLVFASGGWDVLQWWGFASGASHRPTRRHYKIMGESSFWF